jgi:CRP/FNR family transcriptional regulator
MATSLNNKVVKLSETAVACNHCSLHNLCSPPSFDRAAMESLDRFIRKRRPINRGEFLFRAGDPLPSIFCVRSGSVKTYTTTDDGAEMVTGFHLPGELLGLNGISLRTSPSSAVALETSSVCEIPLDHIEDFRTQIPELQGELLNIMSNKILHMQSLMLLLSRKALRSDWQPC